MALTKVIGTETEFGITIRNQPDFNPSVASGLVINAYRGDAARVQWSFEEESPGRDARGFGFEVAVSSDLEAGMANVVLTNGARLYVDHAHPEYSTPECRTPLEAALHDKAGEVVMARAARAAQELVPAGQIVGVYKNNSDGRGNSYGAHENYLLARALPFEDVIHHLTAFLVTRQVFTGSGKLGSENGRPDVDFQLTQRADFFEEEVGLETTLKRPIINTRDEPHGTPSKYRRLHVIIGDATMSETQTFLKVGTTALLLAALEDGALPEALTLQHPVESCWQVSHDLEMRRPLRLEGGATATALDLQWQYHEWLTKYAEQFEGEHDLLLSEWAKILTDLERDPLSTADRLDWAAKFRLLTGMQERDGLSWTDPKLRALNLQFHDVDPERGIFQRLVRRGAINRLFTDSEVDEAATHPPQGTRAYFRGECVARYPTALVAANWDSLVFDTGEGSLTRVPMMEPLRGSKDLVEELLDSSLTVPQLLEALGGSDGRAGTETTPTTG
ncbi:MAG: depupylase/deamidase Dop [Acidimicrobiia bacterium]|nr:depupylase/deamidase Dop [Acidimicrobiia bacterium]